jgi:hypothetical protein
MYYILKIKGKKKKKKGMFGCVKKRFLHACDTLTPAKKKIMHKLILQF